MLLSGKGSVHSAVKLITGIALTVTVISPLVHLDDLNFSSVLDIISADGQWAIEDGEKAAFNQISESIKEESESYILNKANALGMQITADVSVEASMPPVPRQVTITGTISPYGKAQISRFIMEDLGIAEEDQLWIS